MRWRDTGGDARRCPSKQALDDAIVSQATSGFGETFEQLDELLVTISTS
jgi:hypothetical protein